MANDVMAKLAAARALKAAKLGGALSAQETAQVKPATEIVIAAPNSVANVIAQVIKEELAEAKVTPEVAVVATVAEPVATATALTEVELELRNGIDGLDLLAKLDELRKLIHEQHPSMPSLLRLVHNKIRQDPELVTILDDESIGLIISGNCELANIQLGSLAVSKAKSKKPAVGMDDI